MLRMRFFSPRGITQARAINKALTYRLDIADTFINERLFTLYSPRLSSPMKALPRLLTPLIINYYLFEIIECFQSAYKVKHDSPDESDLMHNATLQFPKFTCAEFGARGA